MPDHLRETIVMNASDIVGTCINCFTPGSLGATFALIVVGIGLALSAESRKPAEPHSDRSKVWLADLIVATVVVAASAQSNKPTHGNARDILC
jgi:hypothetical protein